MSSDDGEGGSPSLRSNGSGPPPSTQPSPPLPSLPPIPTPLVAAEPVALTSDATAASTAVPWSHHRALVIGDPCTNPAIINNDGTLNVQFADPWNPSNMEDLATAAPDVICKE